MFEETVRLMTDNFWRADMDGVDWAGVVDLYRPLLERIASYDDLVDVLWEVIGELNTSHAYVMPPVEAGDLSRRLGKLGADLSPADGGWRIDRILPGESSDPDARSPLRAAGVGANEGDVVVAVGGRPVDPRFGPAASLLGVADQPVELTIRAGDAAGSDADRRVVVVPLATEETLRYQDWVRGRAAYVAEHGGGRLGYVHIPDMMGVGWAQLFRSLRQATQREGLIVDVRYNRGGHTSQLVIEQLARRPIGWAVARGLGASRPIRTTRHAGRWCSSPTRTPDPTGTSSTPRRRRSGSARWSACAPGAAWWASTVASTSSTARWSPSRGSRSG